MANEAFALSPIPARAASPSDAEFDAIREAFAETARGRWFLDEYARRNRNADTAMVLEAVARIEGSLAAQKEEQQRQALSEPAVVETPVSEAPSGEFASAALAETMAAVQAIVAAARESASNAMAGPAFEEALAPSRKCARVIREIAWGLRESGADGRICALLELQVDAINAACDHVLAGGLRDGVLQAFDQAAHQIEGIGASSVSPMAEPVAAAPAIDLAAPIELPQEVDSVVVDLFEAAEVTPEIPAPEPIIEMVLPAEEIPPAETMIVSAEPEVIPEPVMTAHLDIVEEINIEPAAEIAPEPVAPEPAATAAMPTLGESLIASGIIARPASPRGDPLAPIRRMSQAEKVAFFS